MTKSVTATKPAKQEKAEKAVVTQPGFAQLAGMGMEKVTAKELIVPRIAILQSLSPQLKKSDASFIKEASVGDICDLGTGQLLGKQMVFVPVYYNKVWIEWYPRASNRGIAAVHNDESILEQCEKDDKGVHYFPDKNKVIETHQLFGLNMTADARRSFVSFASSQIKKVRRLLTMANAERLKEGDNEFCPPIFFRSYMFTTVEESNAEGDWYGWKIERHLTLPEFDNWQHLLSECQAFHRSVSRGETKADLSHMEQHSAPSDSSSEGAM